MRMARILALVAAAAVLAATPARAAESHGGGEGDAQQPATRQDRLTSAPSYLPMPPMQVSLLQHNSTAMLALDMGIDVPSERLRQRANLNGPRLRDALLTALSTYANVFYRDHTQPDPTALTRLLQLAVDRTLGAPGAQVLLVNLTYQRGQSH